VSPPFDPQTEYTEKLKHLNYLEVSQGATPG
jgi:hypothetical protein